MLFLALGPQPSASTNSAILAVRADLYRTAPGMSRSNMQKIVALTTRGVSATRGIEPGYLALPKAVTILLTFSPFLSRSFVALQAMTVLPLRLKTPVVLPVA